jgi:uncharacterized protein YbjT (DUF2867 family)
MKMILITGANSQNGNELIRHLSAKGINIRGLVRNLQIGTALSTLPGDLIVEGDLARRESL